MTRAEEPTRPDPDDPRALRVVLFGLPDAGKSSLLGALAQAGELQERQLGGRLFDVTSGLAELQRRVYQERPRETTQEIVPYPVRYEPLKGGKPDALRRVDLVLYDCDGRAANEILEQGASFPDARSQKLVRNLRRADAVLLVIDAGAEREQIERDFLEFERFLTHFKRYRTQQTEVAGLPVFLVLSKCDLLYVDGDSWLDWTRRIRDRCDSLSQRLSDRLQRHQQNLTGFGTIQIEVIGTAVRRPASFGPRASNEPFAVAELFHRVFLAAADFRQRRDRARRRLWVTFATTVLLFVSLLAAIAGLIGTRGRTQSVPLASVVESYRSRENPTPSSRLTEPLQRKISELTDIQRHPDFARLSEEQRSFVEASLAELVAYQEFKSRLERERPPAETPNAQELDRLEERLRDSLRPPDSYASDWAQTDAELLRLKYLDDIRVLRSAVTEVVDRYSRWSEIGRQLLRLQSPTGQRLGWSDWRDAVWMFLEDTTKKSIRETEILAGSRALPSLRAPALTYAAVFAQTTVARTVTDWEANRRRLQQLLDLSMMLGLGGAVPAKPPWLVFDAKFPFEQIASRVESLRQIDPNFTEWSLEDLEPSVRSDVQAVAKQSYSHLIDSARQRIRQEFLKRSVDGEETRAAWLAVASGILDSREFRAAQPVFRSLQRLSGEPVDDLPTSLAGFLQRPSLPLQIKMISVSIPDDVHTSRLRLSEELRIVQTPPDGQPQIVRLRRSGESLRDNRERRTEYSYENASNQATFEFIPGSAFYVELDAVDERGTTWRFSWLDSRSKLYRYEAIFGMPRFYNPAGGDANTGETRAVRLRSWPEGGVPAVPVLLPHMKP